MDDLKRLISAYLDNELSDSAAVQLAELMQSDPQAIDRFVIGGFIHSHLNEWMDQQRVQDDAMGESVPLASSQLSPRIESQVWLNELLCDCPDLADDLEPVTGLRRLWPQSIAARAAAFVAAVSVLIAAYLFA